MPNLYDKYKVEAGRKADAQYYKKKAGKKAPDNRQCPKCGGWLFCVKGSRGDHKWFDAKLGYKFKEHVC